MTIESHQIVPPENAESKSMALFLGQWLAPLGLLMLCVFGQTFGQSVITGRVRDAKTLQAMPFATVYLNLTTIGVYADDEGRFSLRGIPSGRYDLVVSHVGYQTYQVKVDVKNDSTVLEYDVRLLSQTLKAVTITSDRDSHWRAQLARFHTLFFGNSPLSKDCRILNPGVLDFKEDAVNGFTAEAASPLKIENLSLGYAISYQLKKFQVSNTHYAISGVSWFQVIPTLDTTLINLWSRRRHEVYLGSFRHLLKAIQTQRIEEQGFELYEDVTNSEDVVRKASLGENLNKSIIPIDANSLVPQERHDRYSIPMRPKVEVHYVRKKAIPKVYRNVASPISWIEVKGGILDVNKFGMVLNPGAVMVSGEMSESRISSLLPYDYEPQSNRAAVVRTRSKQETTSVVAAEPVLLERPYLQTDKSFYYADESLWFRAYLNYYSRIYADTLSRVLFVDLVDARKRILTTKIFPIDSTGMAVGSLPLRMLDAGDYQLRAYTRWMLNFDQSLIYAKSIKVLAPDETPVLKTLSADSDSLLEIAWKQNGIRPGMPLIFSIQAKNDYGFQVPASLSVAVVPAAHADLSDGASDIRKQYPFQDKYFPKSPGYSIQQGIDISGKITMPAKKTKKKKKKKDSEPVLVFAQQNSDDLWNIRPEPDGIFRIVLQFYDTARLSAQALTLPDGKQLHWEVDSLRFSPPPGNFHPLVAQLIKMPVQRKPLDTTTMSARLLSEVTVTDTRPREVIGSAIHLTADFVVTGESFKSADNGDFLSMLQARIPGLRVLMFMDGGEIKRMLKLGGFNSFDRNANPEPLVMVDGMILNGFNGTAADQLSTLPATSVDRIEVIRFGGGAAYGARGANGVIAIYTNNLKRTASADSGPIDKTLFRPVDLPGYASPTMFKPLDFDPSVNREGSTIYWNPSVVLDGKIPKTVTFTVPNVAGEYCIVVEGVSSEGKPMRAVKRITVGRE